MGYICSVFPLLCYFCMQSFLFPCIRFMFFLPFHGETKINTGKEIVVQKKIETIDKYQKVSVPFFLQSTFKLSNILSNLF